MESVFYHSFPAIVLFFVSYDLSQLGKQSEDVINHIIGEFTETFGSFFVRKSLAVLESRSHSSEAIADLTKPVKNLGLDTVP